MSKVIIQECKDYDLINLMKKINDGIEKLGDWHKFIKPRDIVLLEVNLIGPKSSETGWVPSSPAFKIVSSLI